MADVGEEILALAKDVIEKSDWITAMTATISQLVGHVTELSDGLRKTGYESAGQEKLVNQVMIEGAVLMAIFAENPMAGIDLKDPIRKDVN